jgi:DNA mismatch repair protein MutL
MALIQKLDDITINKIAAGEVIENPSSVVKELVDNALDAKATLIQIDIRGGGRELIRVKDNGSGMGKEDALLCLERHATSKLKTIEDIQAIDTRGFRGEAIPSIASVSKMTLKTCLKGETIGTLIVIEGGKITLHKEAPLEEGTQIEVENLFFNTPVRRNFQKSPSYDASEIEKMLILLALAHPKISFQLTHNGKTQFSTKQETGSFNEMLKKRMETVLKEEFSKTLHEVDEKKGDYEIKGWLSPPFLTRPNKTGQYVFVNGRAIHSSLVSFAVKQAFGYSIGQNRYPLFVLFLTIPKERVDINVHPQKKEVRFQQEPFLRDFIVEAIEKNLHSLGMVSTVEFTPRERLVFPEIKIETPKTPYKPFQAQTIKKEEPVKRADPLKDPSVTILITLFPYILALIDGEPFLIDQIRAKNRLFFHQVAKQPLQSQRLLIPFSIPFNIEGAELLGFSIKEESLSFLVEAIPSVLKEEESKKFLEDLRSDPSGTLSEERKKRLTQRLAAFTSKRDLNIFEAEALVKNLLKEENSVFCPFGLPLKVPLTADKLKNLMG